MDYFQTHSIGGSGRELIGPRWSAAANLLRPLFKFMTLFIDYTAPVTTLTQVMLYPIFNLEMLAVTSPVELPLETRKGLLQRQREECHLENRFGKTVSEEDTWSRVFILIAEEGPPDDTLTHFIRVIQAVRKLLSIYVRIRIFTCTCTSDS